MSSARPRVGSALRWIPFLTWCSLAMVLGMMYGWMRAEHSPTKLPNSVGVPLHAIALVQSVSANPRFEACDLLLQSVELEGRTFHCRVLVSWRVLDHDSIHVGDRLTLQGVLVIPPLYSATGAPVRARLHQFGIEYEFQGRVLSQTQVVKSPGDRFQTVVLADMEHISQVTKDQSVLIESIVFGGGQVDVQTKNAFRSAGLLHVLAASGANVMLLETGFRFMFYPLWRRLRVPYIYWICLLIALTWLFTAACGFDTSVNRAACMSTYRLFGEGMGRRPGLFSGITCAALVLAVASPDTLVSPSAMLSFAATVAIARALQKQIFLVRFQATRSTFWSTLWTWGGHALRLLRMTIYVEMFVLPILMVVYHQLTPFSILSNLLMDPVLVILLPLSAVWIALTVVAHTWPGIMMLPEAVGWILTGLLAVLEQWVKWIAERPYAMVTVPPIPTWSLIPYFGLLWFLTQRKVTLTKTWVALRSDVTER